MSVAIFISSCDAYRSCWKPFCHGLRKYWPDCPWPIYFVTNYMDPPCGVSLKVGEEIDWTTTQRKALGQISADIILFMLDDFWLTDRVDTGSLMQFADIIHSGRADKIHLVNFSDERKTIGPSSVDKRLHGYDINSKYRTALQGGLWRTSVFLDLLRDGESPWDFEIKGTTRSKVAHFRCLNVKEHRYLIYITRPGAVEKGVWTEMAREYAVREGLQIDFKKRPGGE